MNRDKITALIWKNVVNLEKSLLLAQDNEIVSNKINTLFKSSLSLFNYIKNKKDEKVVIRLEHVMPDLIIRNVIMTPLLIEMRSQIVVATLDRNKVATITGLILAHGEVLKDMDPGDFVFAMGIEDSYMTTFTSTIATWYWLQVQGYQIVRV